MAIDWRSKVAKRCGGKNFDAKSNEYSFSAVKAEEELLARANVPGQPETALLEMSIADPVWKMPPESIDALVRFYHECPDATRYTDNAGLRAGPNNPFGDTHETIVDFLRKRFVLLGAKEGEVTLDNVQYSPHGIKGLLSEYLPTAFFDEKTFLVFPTPGYGVIKSKMNCLGAHVVELPMIEKAGDWQIPYWDLKGYKRFKNRYLYLNVPHNPTGKAYNLHDWQNILIWAKKHNFILIVDEAYTDIRFDQGKIATADQSMSVLGVTGWKDNCLVLQSISKGWSATGARLGWVVGNSLSIAALRKVMDNKDNGLCGLTLAAGQSCLQHPEWADATNREYLSLHQALDNGLAMAEFGLRKGVPDGGLCQFTPAPKTANGIEFAKLVDLVKWVREKLRISLMHYEVSGKWYLRWSITVSPKPEYGLANEMAVIEEAVRRLKQVKFTF
jgi:aspartate/methionine/tyrosine aminotransferase